MFGVESSTLSSGRLAFIDTYSLSFSSLLLSYKLFVCWDEAFCTDSAPSLPETKYAIEVAAELEDRVRGRKSVKAGLGMGTKECEGGPEYGYERV